MRGSRLFALGIAAACILSGCGSPEGIPQSMQQGTVESVSDDSGTGSPAESTQAGPAEQENTQVGSMEAESTQAGPAEQENTQVGSMEAESTQAGPAEQENTQAGTPEPESPAESGLGSISEQESQAELTQPQTTPSEDATELSDAEKEFFTDFIQEYENYGFLLSNYEAPEDVNLSEVLYGGAGFGEPIPKEDVSLYLAAVQRESVETDCLKFARQGIEEFLQRKLGIGLEDIRAPFEWLYISETNAYYKESGDTNYARFFCVEGTRQGDTYTLRFSPEEDWAYWYGDCETVLVQTEEGYRFLSNRGCGE